MIAPSLAELISLEESVITQTFKNNTIVYNFHGTPEDKETLTNTVDNALQVLFAGVEAVTDLLHAVEAYCPEHVSTDTRLSTLWLLKELTQTLKAVNHQEWLLNQSGLTDTKKPN